MNQNVSKSHLGRLVISTGVVTLISILSGCSTIEFVQYEQKQPAPTIDRWHHSTLNGTVEISKPLDISVICGNKTWNSVTTEFTLLNALPVLLTPSTTLVSFYSAWTNKVSCYQIQPKE